MRNILLTSLSQEEISYIRSFIKRPVANLVVRGSIITLGRRSGNREPRGVKEDWMTGGRLHQAEQGMVS
jgi:hypothetical protein